MLKLSIVVAAGSAIGGLLRFWMTTWASAAVPHSLPLGTIAVNILGSFGIGAVAAMASGNPRAIGGPTGHHFLMAGLLGGFTTFSAFSLQTLVLLQQGRWSDAALNVTLSVGLCLGAVCAGWAAVVRS